MLAALIVFVGSGMKVGIQPAVWMRYCSPDMLLALLRKLRHVMGKRGDEREYSAARFLQLAANDIKGPIGVALWTIDLARPPGDFDKVIYLVDADTWHVKVYSPYAGRHCPDCKHARGGTCMGCLGCPACRSLVPDPTCDVCQQRDAKVRAAMLDPNVRIGFVRDLQDCAPEPVTYAERQAEVDFYNDKRGGGH